MRGGGDGLDQDLHLSDIAQLHRPFDVDRLQNAVSLFTGSGQRAGRLRQSKS